MPDRVAPLPAVGAWRDVESYLGSATTPAGGTTMTRVIVTRFLRRTAASEVLAGNLVAAANGGWRFRYTGTAFRIEVVDGGAVIRFAELAVTPANLPRYFIAIATYDGTTLTLRIRTAEGSNGVAGYTAPTNNMSIGVQTGGTLAAQAFAVAAVLGSDTVALDAAARAAAEASIQDDLEQGRFVTLAAGFDEIYWDSRDVISGPVVPGLNWDDRVGAIRLVRQAPGGGVITLQGQGYAARFA